MHMVTRFGVTRDNARDMLGAGPSGREEAWTRIQQEGVSIRS